MKLVRISLSLFLLLGFFHLAGCQRSGSIPSDPSKTKKPVIAVSIVPQKTFVEAVCGDLAEVIVMIPPGSSPENYEPTPLQMERFHQAVLYFAIGVPSEAAHIMPQAVTLPTMKIVKLHEEISTLYPDIEIAPGERDPHIWLSPKRAKAMVQIIARELSQWDLKNQEKYQQNSLSYSQELDKLDQDIEEVLDQVKNRKFIVFHPAFGYLADDYRMKMYSLEEEGKESTPNRLKEMIDLAKKENIKAVFYQAEISSQQAESFAEEIGGQTVQLAPLAPNYIENLRNLVTLLAKVMDHVAP